MYFRKFFIIISVIFIFQVPSFASDGSFENIELKDYSHVNQMKVSENPDVHFDEISMFQNRFPSPDRDTMQFISYNNSIMPGNVFFQGSGNNYKSFGWYRRFTQLGFGVLFGYVAFQSGFGIGEKITTASMDDNLDNYDTSLPFFLGSVTMTFGASFGVWFIGNSRSVKVSYLRILLGTAIGTGLVWATSAGTGYGGTAVMYVPALCGVITHFLYWDWNQASGKRSGALINGDKKYVKFSFPSIFVLYERESRDSIFRINLFEFEL